MPSKKLPQLLTRVKLLAASGARHHSLFLLLQAGKLTPDDQADPAKFKLDPALSGQKAETGWHLAVGWCAGRSSAWCLSRGSIKAKQGGPHALAC